MKRDIVNSSFHVVCEIVQGDDCVVVVFTCIPPAKLVEIEGNQIFLSPLEVGMWLPHSSPLLSLLERRIFTDMRCVERAALRLTNPQQAT